MKVENFKRISLKMVRCEARAFPVGMATCKWPFFTAQKTHVRMNLDTWLVAILFLRETFFASSIMPVGHWQ